MVDRTFLEQHARYFGFTVHQRRSWPLGSGSDVQPDCRIEFHLVSGSTLPGARTLSPSRAYLRGGPEKGAGGQPFKNSKLVRSE